MKPLQIKGFLTEKGIRFDVIAAECGVDPSYISHVINYRRNNAEIRRFIEAYVRREVDDPELILFDDRDAPEHGSPADSIIGANTRQRQSRARSRSSIT